MRVRYTESALAETNEICSYIARDNPVAAAKVAAAIERTVAAISGRNRHRLSTKVECTPNWWDASNIASFSKSMEKR